MLENSIWKKVGIQFVGGLVQVGFAKRSDLLLVLSHNGQGIFNCLTGEKIARDKNALKEFFNEETLVAKGFDLLEEKEIETAGLFGGTLSTKTEDGWKLSVHELNIKSEGIYLSFENDKNEILVANNEILEIRAFGFSETGKSFVVATPADLTIFSRQL